MKTERTITGRRKSILSKMNTVCNAKWEESTMCVLRKVIWLEQMERENNGKVGWNKVK